MCIVVEISCCPREWAERMMAFSGAYAVLLEQGFFHFTYAYISMLLQGWGGTGPQPKAGERLFFQLLFEVVSRLVVFWTEIRWPS